MPTYRLPGDKPPPAVLTPIFDRTMDGDIVLQLLHINAPYNIAFLTADGRLALCPNIPTGLGLQVDECGRIQTVDENGNAISGKAVD